MDPEVGTRIVDKARQQLVVVTSKHPYVVWIQVLLSHDPIRLEWGHNMDQNKPRRIS